MKHDSSQKVKPENLTDPEVAISPFPASKTKYKENQHVPPVGIWKTLDSLRVPGYRWFVTALMSSFAAMNIQMFIRGYLVFQLTDSYAYLGALSIAQGFPMLALSMFGGVLADSVQKKYVVQAGQIVNSLNAFLIAFWIISDLIVVQHLLAAAFVQGAVMALQQPSRQALTPEVVGLERLTNALGLSMVGLNINRLIMPALAGSILAIINPEEGIGGAEYIYIVMGSFYLFASVLMIPVPKSPRENEQKRTVHNALLELKDGMRYVKNNSTVRVLLITNLLIVSGSMPYQILLPGIVDEILGVGKSGLGFLMSLQGIGSIFGSLFIASMGTKKRGRMMLYSGLLLSISLLLFSLSTNYFMTAGILIVVGLSQIGRMSLGNVLIQSYSEAEYRGRVMSLFYVSFGISMFATFLIGIIAAWVGPQIAIGASSIWLLILVIYLMIKTEIPKLD
ncbi:MAG: MFS transporter [Dehalococcoidia bacterium]|nr:MFS transporter [Dehalococcoidia bacterium]